MNQGLSQGLSWEAIIAILTLFGLLFTALGGIAVSLLGAIFRRLGQLSESLASQRTELNGIVERWKECRDDDHATHRRLWVTVEDHSQRLDDHEHRIGALET